MHARERIIRERFAAQTCEGCGQPYLPGSVLILARRRSAWMVLVSCPRCDHRGIFVVSFRHGARPASHAWPPPDLDTLPDALNLTDQSPVSPDDVARIRDFLAHFDGDFRKLFSSPPSPPAPPSS